MTDKASQSGKLVVVEATPVIVPAAYGAGDLIGTGKLTFPIPKNSARAGEAWVVENVVVSDLAAQSANMDLLLFDADPSATTFTDNAALDVADADLVKLVGFVMITSWAALADNSLGRGEASRPLPVLVADDAKFYGA